MLMFFKLILGLCLLQRCLASQIKSGEAKDMSSLCTTVYSLPVLDKKVMISNLSEEDRKNRIRIVKSMTWSLDDFCKRNPELLLTTLINFALLKKHVTLVVKGQVCSSFYIVSYFVLFYFIVVCYVYITVWRRS